MNEPVTIDLQSYADQVARQRNDALDHNAKLSVFVEQLKAELVEARAEVERLRGTSAE